MQERLKVIGYIVERLADDKRCIRSVAVTIGGFE
jgi:hypothetical protein